MNPSFAGWLCRDAAILAVSATIMHELHAWQQDAPSRTFAISASLVGFVLTYMLIYIAHEWGHWMGARASRSEMRFAPYASPLIGFFDTEKHSAAQFLALSWGGVLAYVSASTIATVIFLNAPGHLTAGVAVAGIAFTAQSLAVDLPQIIKVHRHADPQTTNQQGTVPALIIRRTWQTWLPLVTILLIWNLEL